MSIKRVSAHEEDIFIPQVFGNGRFSSFSLSAFQDLRDDPTKMRKSWDTRLGNFNEFNRHVTDHARLRELTPFVMENEFYRKFQGDIITFDAANYHYARTYAQLLADFGRWAHAWSNPHNWPKYDRRGERLQVRLVRSRSASIVEEYPI